ncbi:MAG: hypothetical protein ACOZQL_07345 [Myxococcota bacterium]
MRPFLVLVAVFASAAVAQTEPSAPPVIPTPEEQPAIPAVVTPANPPLPPEPAPPSQQYVEPTYFERCFAVPAQVWIPGPTPRTYYRVSAASSAPLSNFHAAQPVDAPRSGGTSSSGGGSSSSGGGISDGKALLVLAVVAVAVLPIVVYAVDDDAPAVVENRFHCPTFGFDAVGGFESSVAGVGGTGAGRLTFGYSYFGSDFQFDLSSRGLTSWAGHLLVRIGPKAHIEPNLAFGVRSLAFQGQTRAGFEVGVPHRYVFWRSGLRSFALELRPTFMFAFDASSFDVGLEAAFIIPLVEPLHLRVGGRFHTFGESVIGGLNAGLTFVF